VSISQVKIVVLTVTYRQLCPTQMAYWAKKYVTNLTRAAQWMACYWGPRFDWIDWLTLILAN